MQGEGSLGNIVGYFLLFDFTLPHTLGVLETLADGKSQSSLYRSLKDF